MSHAFLISDLCIELLETQFMTFPVKNKEYILDIKNGKIPVNEVINSVEDNLLKVDKLIDTTELPEKVDNDFATQILLELYAL